LSSACTLETSNLSLEAVTREKIEVASIPQLGHTSLKADLQVEYLLKASQVSNILKSS